MRMLAAIWVGAMRRPQFRGVLLLAIVAAGGCVAGEMVAYDDIRPGLTTMAQVQAAMGEPWAGAQGDLWVYLNAQNKNIRVEIEFYPSGIVSAKRRIDSSPASPARPLYP